MGTGKTVVPMPPHLKKYLNGLGIQVDVFDSVRCLHSSLAI
jgi:hypothetical protein